MSIEFYNILYLLQNGKGNGKNALDSCPTEFLSNVSQFYDIFDKNFLWIYPFIWCVIIVRKMFFV